MLGLSFEAFTALHIGVSLAGIGTGLVALGAILAGRWLPGWVAAFLVTTALSVGTGFLFGAGVTPAAIVGVLTSVALLVAAWALYRHRLRGTWRRAFVTGMTAAIYFNIFVAAVQMFQKFPSLAVLAPTQTEIAFVATQILLLGTFVGLGRLAWRG